MDLISDLKSFVRRCKKQDKVFYCAAAYLIFEYLRPHTIFPWLDFLPWARLSLIAGLLFLVLERNLKFQLTHFLLLIFVCIVSLSCVYSAYPDISFKALNVPVSWLFVVLVFSNSIRTIEQLKLLLILFFLIVFKMSLFGAKTWVLRGFSFTAWGIAGPHGWFENSGELALLMVIFTCFSFGYLVSLNIKKKLYYLVPITGAMTIIAASSRGSQLAFAIMLVLAALFLWKINIKNVLIVLLVSWLGYALMPTEQKERFNSMGDDKTSESRLAYWQAGLDMLNDNKALGIGFNVFPQYFEEHYAPYMKFEKFVYHREVAHNTLIQVSSEMGYLGLIAYLLLVIHCFVLTRQVRTAIANNKDKDKEWLYKYSRYTDLAMVGYLIGSFFMSVALYPYVYLFLSFNQGMKNVALAKSDSAIKQ